MVRRSHDAIPSPNNGRHQRGEDIALDAPPQRDPNRLAVSEDLGGVVDPADSDLIHGAGWSSWSAGERLAVVAVVVVVAVLAAVLGLLLLG